MEFSAENIKGEIESLRRVARISRANATRRGRRSPRKLDPRAERFLAEYQPEEAGSVLALYWRYHSLEAEEFDTVEEAERFLKVGADYGDLAGEAIVAGDEIRVLP